MTKLRTVDVLNDLDHEGWSHEVYWIDEYEYREEYWNHYDTDMEYGLSWQWYMERDIRLQEGWSQVVVNKQHKYQTVKNWLNENYPGCKFKNERNHFLIQDQSVAIMATLKWT